MIPLRDNIPTRDRPVVNIALIVLCAIAFFVQLRQDPAGPSLVERYGMIPARVLHPDRPVIVQDVEVVGQTRRGTLVREVQRPAAPAGVPVWLTLLTCIFLHGGWMHFLGNMWFLWIFGDNVEDCFGRLGYLAFYLASGIGASAVHLLTNASSSIPTIGASGAIAGVMGAYFVLYPKAKVLTLVPLFIFIEILVLPASIFLGVWFAIQFFQGAFAIGSMQSTGVAWWAHIGGFVVGYLAARGLKAFHRLRPSVEVLRPNSDRVTHYRVRARRPRTPWQP